MSKIYCLMGPTATGKTALAIELVKRFPFDIISVDSAMVYRGMDIGSAKPSAEELAIAPHRLINIRDPQQPYSAADFRADAMQEIESILKSNRMPLLVGGTMLYFKALQQGLSALPPADETIRAKILEEAQEKGWQYLHEKLQKIDPAAAARIHPNDPQRLQRALEVYEITGESLTDLQSKQTKDKLPYEFVNVGLMPDDDRELLREKINNRFLKMLDDGLIEEVKKLYARDDLHPNLPALRAVGYRQMWEYLDGKFDEKQMQETVVTVTCQLAKRQMTWLRHWPEVQKINPEHPQLLEEVIKMFGVC